MEEQTRRKNLLFIAPKFYDYHSMICEELKLQNYQVIFFENKFFREDPLLNKNDTISRVKRILNPNYKSNYNNYIVEEVSHLSIDILFCIGGFSITEELVTRLRKDHPNMQTIAYFWDSFDVWDYRNLISSFHNVFTFDRSDALKYKLTYLPLFYYFGNDKLIPYQERTTDLLFIGSLGYYTVNRLATLKYFEQCANTYQLNSFLWLYFKQQSPSLLKKILNWFRLRFSNGYSSFINQVKYYTQSYQFVKHETISSEELPKIFRQAKCVIDIPVPGQVGLTMRTIEALASGSKLITTNPSIKEEPFYTPALIYVIDENSLSFDIDFLEESKDTSINIDYLSLHNWLSTILRVKQAQ